MKTKTLQIFEPAYLQRCKKLDKAQILQFLEEFRLFFTMPFPPHCDLLIRQLMENDIALLTSSFTFHWSTPEKTAQRWKKRLEDQRKGIGTTWLITQDGEILGYGTLLKQSNYRSFIENGIPEINDLWIKESFRCQGLATALIGHLEKCARQDGYSSIGLAVGLYGDYGPAQRLYNKLGFQPDGRGATYLNLPVIPGQSYPIDDDLLLWLIKSI